MSYLFSKISFQYLVCHQCTCFSNFIDSTFVSAGKSFLNHFHLASSVLCYLSKIFSFQWKKFHCLWCVLHSFPICRNQSFMELVRDILAFIFLLNNILQDASSFLSTYIFFCNMTGIKGILWSLLSTHIKTMEPKPLLLIPFRMPFRNMAMICHNRDIPPHPVHPVASTHSPVRPELAPSQPDPHPDPVAPCPRLRMHSAASAMLM